MSSRVQRLSAVVLFLFVAFGSLAQTNSESSEPQPYAEDEFTGWMLSLRRAEIVATGTLPLTLLASRVVYSLIRFGIASISAGTVDLNYAPWFFAPPGAPDLTRTEKLGVVLGAIGLSSVIAWIDYLIVSSESADDQ